MDMNENNNFETLPSEQDAKHEALKARKREAAQRYKENREKEKAQLIANAKQFIEEAKAEGLWDMMSDKQRGFIEDLATPAVPVSTKSTFATLFGTSAKVGDTITLNEAFQKTLKGKANLDFYVRKWAEKGIIVEFVQAENILESTYVIRALSDTTDAE